MQKMLMVMAVLFGWLYGGAAQAAFVDCGANVFQDTLSGLYWHQPAAFQGYGRPQVASFIESNPVWHLATADEFRSLHQGSADSAESMDRYLGQALIRHVGMVYYEGYLAAGFGGLEVATDAQVVDDYFVDGKVQYANAICSTYLHNNQSYPAEYQMAWLCTDRVPPQCSSVPLPGAVWLLGSGLAGLAGLRRLAA